MPGCGIRANDQTIVSHHLPVKFLVRLEAVQINGEILKRWNGVIFGFSNVVINATPLPKPTEGFKAEPFWHPAPFPTLLSSLVEAMFQGLPL